MNDLIPYYLPSSKEIEVVTQAFMNKLPVLLKGPTGAGKSRFVEFMAHKLGKKCITISCHEETSSTDLIGRFIIKGSETIWIDGPMVTAMKEGAILYLDEVAEARPDVVVAMHPLSDHRREIFIDKLGISIKAHPDFFLIASFNPGYQRGFKELKPSTRQRFVAIAFDYPTSDLEIEIVMNESGITHDDAKKIVSIGTKIRNLKDIGLTETVSTRLLIDAAKLIKSGLPKRLAVQVGILEPLTDDRDIVQALSDLSNLII